MADETQTTKVEETVLQVGSIVTEKTADETPAADAVLGGEDIKPAADALVEKTAEAELAKAAPVTPTTTEVAPKTDEEFLAEFEKRTGRKVASIDELKAPAPEPTEIEKIEKELEDVAIVLKMGFKAGDLGEWKKTASVDLEILSVETTIKEYTDVGYTREEALEEIKVKYHQLTQEEIDDLDIGDKSLAIQRKKFFGNQLANRAFGLQETAKNNLQQLNNKLEEIKSEKLIETKLEAEADSLLNTIERKLVVGLGDFNGLKLRPVEHEVSQEDLVDVIDNLKNKERRLKLLFKEDGTENLPRLAELLLIEKRFNAVAIKAAAQSANEQVEIFEKTATRNPSELEGQSNRAKAPTGANEVLQVGRIVKN